MINPNKFFKKLEIEGTKIQISTYDTILKEISYNESFDIFSFIKENNNKHLFFLAGIDQTAIFNTKREVKDEQILYKNFIAFDFDDLTKEDYIPLKDALDSSSNFSDYSYIIFTGGGFHVYYFGQPFYIHNKDWFKLAMQDLQELVKQETFFNPDPVVVNTARIMRVPGSFNIKPNRQCWGEILIEKDIESNLLSLLLELGTEKPLPPPQTMPISLSGDKMIDAIISIPIEDVVLKVWKEKFGISLKFEPDNHNHFFNIGEKKYHAFFKSRKGYNILHAGGTHFLNKQQGGYSPFSLVKELITDDNASTYKWFEDNYLDIKKIADKDKKDWIKNQKDLTVEKKTEIKDLSIFEPENFDDILAQDYGEYKYVINDLIPREGITIISAQAKTGKSWFLLYLLSKIIRGEEVFDRQSIETNILIIDEENSKRGLKRRENMLEKGLKGFGIKIINQKNWKLDNDENRNKIIEIIKNNNIEMLIIDSLVRIHTSDEKESKDSAILYSYFKEIMLETGVGIIITHHNRKMKANEKITLDAVRGSGDIVAFAEAILVLQSKELRGKENLKGNSTYIYPFLRESGETKTFRVDWYDDPNNDGKIKFDYKGEIDDKMLSIKLAFDNLKSFFEENTTKKYLKKQLEVIFEDSNFGKSAITDALKMLLDQELIKKTKGNGLIYDGIKFSKNADVFFSINYKENNLLTN